MKTNIATEKKLMKQITDEQSMERKSFDNKMSHEYKLKKEMWKREMSDRETSKREREAILSQHKEQYRELEAAQNQRLNRSQKETLDREVRKFRRRRLVKYHDLEQDLLREVGHTLLQGILIVKVAHTNWAHFFYACQFSLLP